MRALLAFALWMFAAGAVAQIGSSGTGDNRWNVNGPNWYETKCGHIGFSVTHGLPYSNYREPCSVPIRVCEFKRLTINYPADPDVPCERMANADAAGPLQRTYIRRWD